MSTKLIGHGAAVGPDRDLLAPVHRHERKISQRYVELALSSQQPFKVEDIAARPGKAHHGFSWNRNALEPVHLPAHGSESEQQAKYQPSDRSCHCCASHQVPEPGRTDGPSAHGPVSHQPRRSIRLTLAGNTGG